MRVLVAPGASTFIFSLAMSLLPTLTTLMIHNHHWGTWAIGQVASCYYIGMILGALYSRNLIYSWGLKAAFIAFVEACTAVTLLQGWLIQPYLWMVLRFLCGFALSGVFIVIESWFIQAVPLAKKNNALSLYALLYYVSIALGQLLLLLKQLSVWRLFYWDQCFIFACYFSNSAPAGFAGKSE